MDFRGKVVIITGASSGVGAATAKLLAKYNAILTLVGRNEQRLRQVTEICEAAKGISPLAIKMDLTENGSCEEVVNRTIQKFGRLDVLVNCAGHVSLSSLFDEDIDSFDELFKINLRVPFKLSHLALPHLTKTKGNIVNLRGAMFETFRQGFLSYSIMNSAIEKFTKAAAVDVASSGVRVNVVSIALTHTNLLDNLNYDNDDRQQVYSILQKELMITVMQPEEVAKMIAFVASSTCPNINGANIFIDGTASFK